MLLRRLSLALAPLALSANLLAQASVTYAESPTLAPVRRVLPGPVPTVEIPHRPPTLARSVALPQPPGLLADRIACATCEPAPTLEANWGDGTYMSSKVMLIKGQNFPDGDTIEVDVLGDLAHLFLYSTSVTSADGGFEIMPGFEAYIDTGVLQCSSPVSVAATDLTVLHASGQPEVPVQTTPTGCIF